MRKLLSSRVLCGLLLLCAVALGDAAAGGRTPPKRDGFAQFCSRWMDKLAARERFNLERVEYRERDGALIAEYRGYDRKPTRCDSRVEKPGAAGVGVLVYNELLYRKQGPDRVRARAAVPEVVERVEIMEVFRYDGSRWSY